MRWLDKLKVALRREATEAKDVYRAAHDRLDADLSRREADLAASPEEKLARMAQELDQQDDAWNEVRARIEALGSTGGDQPGGEQPGGPPATPGAGEDGSSGGSGSRSC